MSNERLRSVMAQRAVTIQDLSEVVAVDPKTVERWVTKERVPHRSHRLKVAAHLGTDDVYLWPGSVSQRQASAAAEAELVTLYPNRGAIPVDVWLSLVDSALESIDLLAFSGSFLHDALPGFVERIAARAKAGVRVRLLFGDPSAPAVGDRGEEEGIGDLVTARCRLTWVYFQPLLGQPGIEGRMHDTPLYNSIYRFDSAALINTHAYGSPASHSPTLHLHRVAGGRLFDHYASSFDKVWGRGTPVTLPDAP